MNQSTTVQKYQITNEPKQFCIKVLMSLSTFVPSFEMTRTFPHFRIFCSLCSHQRFTLFFNILNRHLGAYKILRYYEQNFSGTRGCLSRDMPALMIQQPMPVRGVWYFTRVPPHLNNQTSSIA